MGRHRLTDAERSKRTAARTKIVEAATKHRQRRIRADGLPFLPPAFAPRHIHQAVHVVRAQGLVDAGVLADAGFRPRRRST